MKLPSIWFQKGAIFNMRLSKGALDTDENKEKVIAMIKVLFENYGQQIQFNVVDNKYSGRRWSIRMNIRI